MNVPPDVSSGTISSVSVITQAYLNVTQSITQGFYNEQSVKIDCNKNSEVCNKCIQLAKDYNLVSNDDYSQACSVCFCTLENINLNSVIKLNLSSFLQNNSEANFQQQVLNSITQSAGDANQQLFNFSDTKKNALNSTASNIYQKITNTTVQKSLQQLKEFQILSLKNSNTQAINVNMSIATSFISNIFQNNSDIASDLSDMQNTITQLTSSTESAGFASIISIIVTLAIIFIIGLVSIFAFGIIMQILELYVIT